MLAEQFLEPSIIFFRLGWDPKSLWTKVRFDGAVLSNLDIKRCIMTHERLLNDKEVYDLVLTNMQTGEEFRDEGFLVPRNSALVARKIPCTKEASQRIRKPALSVDSSKKEENIYGGGRIIGKPTAETDASVADFLAKGDDFAEVTNKPDFPGTPNPQEDSSLNAFGLGGLRFAYRFDPQAKPPPGYICHRCEQPGHFIRFCPTNDNPNFNFRRIKPATGIPVSFMRPTANPADEANPLQTASTDDTPSAGSLVRLQDDAPATALPNQRQFARALAESGSSVLPEGLKKGSGRKGSMIISEAAPEMRKELRCPLCREPFINAVMTLCCFSSFCDHCIRKHIAKSPSNSCPNCSKEIQKKELKPNKVFQKAVDDYVEEHPENANALLRNKIPNGAIRQEKNPEMVNPFNMTMANQMMNRPINPNNTCFRCGEKGHYMAQCQNKVNASAYHPMRREKRKRFDEERTERRRDRSRDRKREKPRYKRKF